ncbi:MAG: aminopeptidase [Bdellovibrionales bacterium]|jgi:aminopeptidase|nr:aminopeptidase [Bdellovibrionales bacterium]MBT3524935.1 aminopeptidase [Bdellovibrionales bacterium]MBT7766977.1 aminopeptidase [Bdellovibrionales bacterium]
MNWEIIKESYAELILKSGIKIREGQCIQIQAEPYHWPFVHILEKKAYELGAKYVYCKIDHPMSTVNMSRYQKAEYRGSVPSFLKPMIESLIEDEWSFLYFDGKADPELGKQINQEAMVKTQQAMMKTVKPMVAARMDGRCTWTIGALPTPKWAQMILGGRADEENLKALWKILTPILRLDRDDPAQAWQAHAKTLKARCQSLNNLSLSYLHFVGPQTDLKVHLAPRSRWTGGQIETAMGRSFIPNVPTEEVFTSPDFRKTEGKVKVTRPVTVLGDQVVGAWFEFKQGKVIDHGADEGKELLDRFFEIDEKARFLGEVALVDASSPIFQSGLIFHSILLDENAACHIALGRAIDLAIDNHQELKTEDEKKAAGFNQSLQHIDFMIGSEEISVTGYSLDGKPKQIIESGQFTI